MNLERGLHTRWAADVTLIALLPAARVTTGVTANAAPPYCVLSKTNGRPRARFNDGTAVDDVEVRFTVLHEDHAAGLAIANQVRRSFDRCRFDLADSNRVIWMQRTGESDFQDEDGIWNFVLTFRCLVGLAVGA